MEGVEQSKVIKASKARKASKERQATLKDKFLKTVNDNYDELKRGYKSYCLQQKLPYDEDVFSDTIIKCHDAIMKKGSLKDDTQQGIKNYFYQALKINAVREQQYARNKKRNKNNENLKTMYEEWFNRYNDDGIEKLKSDLYKDFATLYLMQKVEENFDAEHFYLFRIKHLTPDCTYEKLRQKTNIKGAREKVIEVNNWLKNNVSKEDIKEAFLLRFKNFL